MDGPLLASGNVTFGTATTRDRVGVTGGRFGAAGFCAMGLGLGLVTRGGLGGGGCREAGGTITMGMEVAGAGGSNAGRVRTPSQPVPAGFTVRCTAVEADVAPPQA